MTDTKALQLQLLTFIAGMTSIIALASGACADAEKAAITEKYEELAARLKTVFKSEGRIL